MDKKIKVKTRPAFGRIDYLPANDLAQQFCELIEKPNLPLKTILKLKKMGYEVVEEVSATL